MAHDEHVPADFESAFRERFATLFGRKIGRQRAEQYLGGLLSGRAERRNVTSLAGTVDGATARALGWLLNKSPWPTRPVIDALQTYVADSLGDADGLFTLYLDSFVKRGDNAVGVEKQHVPHLGRTLNCQIGVFLAYGSARGSALVDAALYMPRSWTDDPVRRTRAGVPDALAYRPRAALALDLLQGARAAGHLRSDWVTTWHGEGFEPDLRSRLAADGWQYLLPVPADAALFESADAPEAVPVAALLARAGGDADAPAGPPAVRRIWEADGEARRPAWLLVVSDALTGAPVAYLSNAPADAAAEALRRVLAARTETARMLAARCSGVSLDVYRVRGWDGWHRHVALASLASGFRACLPSFAAERAALADGSAPAAPADEAMLAALAAGPASADPLPETLSTAAAAVTVEDALRPEHDETHPDDAVEFALPLDAAVFEAGPAAGRPAERVNTTFRLSVDLDDTDWRAVRAFQTWLVADGAGQILFSSPTRAEIERQEVGARMELRFESLKTLEEVLTALDEVPEIVVSELVAEARPQPADADADAGLEGADDLLAALQAELASRTEARDAGLMPAFEGPAQVVGNAVADITRALEEARELVPAPGRTNGNGHANGDLAAHADRAAVLEPLGAPNAPAPEAPVRPEPAPPAADAPAAAGTPAGQPSLDQKRQAAERARPAEEQVVVLDLGDEAYGIPVQRVREIIRVPPITRVPNGPAFLEGVINLRGQVIPVMDLRKHLGITSGDETRRSRVVVSELGQHTVGLMVDGVSQVVMVAATDIEPPPAIVAGANNGQVCGVARLSDRLVLFLDPDRVLPGR